MSSQPPRFLGRKRIRRAAAALDAIAMPQPPTTAEPSGVTAQWEGRIAHLEQLVQGLQDSAYREWQRQDKRIAELEKRVDPASLAAALSQDARERGL